MYGNSDKPVDFSKKPRDVPRKLQSNVYKELTHRELGFNLGRSNLEIEAVAEDKLVTKNYLEMRCELPPHTRSTFLMVFSPDGKKVASTHGNHNVYVTDLTTGKNLNTLSGHPRTPWCIAFHPSSNQILATGCLGGQVRVWDLHGGSEVWMAQGQTVIASLAFHPTDRMLVIATYNELHFWDWSQSAPFAKCYTSNEKEKVRYVAFDPLGHKLITGISNVPPHSTQWDRSAGSHNISHHHHLYHHQPFQRSGRFYTVPCSHYQQSPNVSGERTGEQLERDGRVNDGLQHLSSQLEGRIQSTSGEATSSSTSSSNPPHDFERRISVCYRSLAQRYEQLLQRYFDLVRPRYVVTTDRGTDPMEAEETSRSSGSAVTAGITNRCTCNNTATNTNSNWTVTNRSGQLTTTSNTRARKSTRDSSTAVNASSSSSASNVNGTRTTNGNTRRSVCPCFNDADMCRTICHRRPILIRSRTLASSGTNRGSSTSTSVASSSTNCANMQSGSQQASTQAVSPGHITVHSEVSNREQDGQPSQSANYSSVNSPSHKASDPSDMANENSLSCPAVRPAESVTTSTACNRMEIEQAENAAVVDPSSAGADTASPDTDDQNVSGPCSVGQQEDLQPQAQSTISSNQREQLGHTEQAAASRRQESRRLRLSTAHMINEIEATTAVYRDVRRLQCGINTLNHQLDSIQSFCRARMDTLQLQQVQRVWGNLRSQINSLQASIHQVPQPNSSVPFPTEEDQPAQVPNVSQLLELARISDGEPADEASELIPSTSSFGRSNVVITECDDSETEETASTQSSQDRTGDGEMAAKRVKIDTQSSSTNNHNELVTDGANDTSNVNRNFSEPAIGNTDSSTVDKGHKHGNICGRNKLERNTSTAGSKNVAGLQGHSTQNKSEKVIENNLPVAGLLTSSCSSASCSTSQNSDCVAGPSKINSDQEQLHEMQNISQEHLNDRRNADRQGISQPESEPVSSWKFCPLHGTKVAHSGACRNCASHLPNTSALYSNSPKLQSSTANLGIHLPQPQSIFTTVRPQESVASSHSRPTNTTVKPQELDASSQSRSTNLVPHETTSCKTLQQSHSEMCTPNCSNVKGNIILSKEMTHRLFGKNIDSKRTASCVASTCCTTNASKRTREEQGENSASSQHDDSKEQDIPLRKHPCGKNTHSQNQVKCSNVTEGVPNNVNKNLSKSESVASPQEQLPCDTSVINGTNKRNSSLHSDSTPHNVENNSVEANSCRPAGNPADLLSETAAYPANMHPFIPGGVTNFCGNLGESSSQCLYDQQNTHLNSTPEDLRSPERRTASSGDNLPQVKLSCQQNDNVYSSECTSSNQHFDSSTSTRQTVSHSPQQSDGISSQSERSSDAPGNQIAEQLNPSIIPRQGPLMCPLPDPLLVPRPGPLQAPRASPLPVPGSVQESLRCPRMLHVGGRYYVPRQRFHHRTGHCSRGRTLSRPVVPAEPLRRPWFLQTLTQTYRTSAGSSGGELGGRCNEFIRQIGATQRNPISRPTRNCTSHIQQRESHGTCNQYAEDEDTYIRWGQSRETSNGHSESTLQASSSNYSESGSESRVETAVNMTKDQSLSCTSETSEQSGESSSSKQSVSITSAQLVAHTNINCAQLPEIDVKLPSYPSDLDRESSTVTKHACTSDNTVSQPVTEIPHSSQASSSGNNDSAPLGTSTLKDVSHSISQNVGCKAGQSTAVREKTSNSTSASTNANSSNSQCTVPNKEDTTENMPQKTVEPPLSQSSNERNNNVNVSQPQESGGRSAATQTPGPPLRRPDSVGVSAASHTPVSQSGVSQQFPRYGTGQTVREIFGRLQRLLETERLYRQAFIEPGLNPQIPRRSNTTPAHSNTAEDLWGSWTRRHSGIASERNAEDERTSYTGRAATVAAERLVAALQTELCETERLYQRIVNLPRSTENPEISEENTRVRARQVLCEMIESLTQVFEDNDPFNSFSTDVSDHRVRIFLSDLYFLLQLAVELVDLLQVQIARPWGNLGAQLANGVESTSNSRHYMRDQMSHSRPRGTGSFRFYARRGNSAHRPSDGYSRQPSAGASGSIHTNPARTLSRNRNGRSLGRNSWVHRFFGASTGIFPVMRSTAVTDEASPQVCIVTPVDDDDLETGGENSRSSHLPASTRGVRGHSQRGSSTSHHGHQQRQSHLFHNFHNYCRQPEEEGQEEQQHHSHPNQHNNHQSQQQHQNVQELEQQQQQQLQQPEEEQQSHHLSIDSEQQQQGQSQQQLEQLEQQLPDGHVQERNSEYRNEHSENQTGSDNQEPVTSRSQILNSSRQTRQQAQRNSDMFAVPAVQLNDVPIADVGQLSQVEPPHVRPQSPPANPFGVVSRQSQQMLGGLPPSERWLVNFDEVYPNPGFTNSTSTAERRLYPPVSFMGYGQGSQSEPSSRPSTSNFPGSSRGPINSPSAVNDGNIHRPQIDSGSWTYGAPTGWRSRFLHPRYVGPNMFNDDAFASIENVSFIRGPDTVIITDAPLSPNHRIQAWDISKFNVPDISNAEKNIIVSECKIHNDASVDVSKDGTLLVTLLPSTRICVTTMLGIYSLEWESLGQCLYTTSFEQNAVSVSLSPACRHLLVGLASRRIVLTTDRPTVAQIFRMEGAKPGRSVGGRGRLCHLRDIEHNRENSFTSLNCIRWAPEPGQGLVYGTNTGTLRILR